MEPTVVAVVAVVSALAAVASALYARTANQTTQRIYAEAKELYDLQPKRDVLRRLVGSLHFAVEDLHTHPQRVELAAALNEAVAAFGDDREVAHKLRALKSDQKGDSFLPVIRAMAVAAKLPLDEFDDAFLKSPFSI